MWVPGATVIGAVYDRGVLLAADRRVSYGTFVLSKNAKKIYKITDKVGIASAGLISDIQTLIRMAKYEANMYKLQTNRDMTARALAKLLSNALFAYRLTPLLTQTVVGGFDFEKKSVYILDALGSIIEDKYAALGSGAEIALGVLESSYRDEDKFENLREVVVKAMKAALERDAASGNGVDFLRVEPAGVTEEFVSF
ncbi:MAG: proteasome subunit beta [Thermoproteota archaeon]